MKRYPQEITPDVLAHYAYMTGADVYEQMAATELEILRSEDESANAERCDQIAFLERLLKARES